MTKRTLSPPWIAVGVAILAGVGWLFRYRYETVPLPGGSSTVVRTNRLTRRVERFDLERGWIAEDTGQAPPNTPTPTPEPETTPTAAPRTTPVNSG